MIPVVGVSGVSGSGKTTLIEKLVVELSKRGHKVATIKHHRGALEFDIEGKDSRRHKDAGSVATALVTPKGMAVVRDHPVEPDVHEIAERYLFDADIVLAEGYKTERLQKIVVVADGSKEEMALVKDDLAVAVASDLKLDGVAVKRFKRNDSKAMADFIEERFLNEERESRTSLRIDGKLVYMKGYVRETLEAIVKAFISKLNKADVDGKITLFIEKEPKKKKPSGKKK